MDSEITYWQRRIEADPHDDFSYRQLIQKLGNIGDEEAKNFIVILRRLILGIITKEAVAQAAKLGHKLAIQYVNEKKIDISNAGLLMLNEEFHAGLLILNHGGKNSIGCRQFAIECAEIILKNTTGDNYGYLEEAISNVKLCIDLFVKDPSTPRVKSQKFLERARSLTNKASKLAGGGVNPRIDFIANAISYAAFPMNQDTLSNVMASLNWLNVVSNYRSQQTEILTEYLLAFRGWKKDI